MRKSVISPGVTWMDSGRQCSGIRPAGPAGPVGNDRQRSETPSENDGFMPWKTYHWSYIHAENPMKSHEIP